MKPEKKIDVRRLLHGYATEFYKKDFSKLSGDERSRALLRWYIEEVLNTESFYISEDDIDAGYVDAANDYCIDFIHKDDSNVIIIQSKYHKDGTGSSREEVSDFKSSLNRLINKPSKPNKKLEDALSFLDFESDNFYLKFLNFGKTSLQTKEEAEIPLAFNKDAEGLKDRSEFEYLDEQSIAEKIRMHDSDRIDKEKKVKIYSFGERAKRSQIISLNAGIYKSYVMTVDANQIVQLYNATKNAIFSYNIRNYIGKTATNKKIVECARTDASSFYLYNNGISCLANEVIQESDHLEIRNLQIINGAQTVRSLHMAAKSGRLDPAPVVLFRVTEVPNAYADGKRTIENITRYNNTQNVVKASDFRSNDEIHTNLGHQFGELSRRGKKVQYIPKRTYFLNSKTHHPIKLEEFAKTIYSFIENPVDFSSSTSILFDDSEKGGYLKIFGDGKNVYTRLDRDTFKYLAGIWWLGEDFAAQLESDREKLTDITERAALERKWFVFFSAMVIVQDKLKDDAKKFFMRNYKGDITFGVGESGKKNQELYVKAKTLLISAYRNSMENQTFNHRNWQRSIKAVNSIRNISSLVDFSA